MIVGFDCAGHGQCEGCEHEAECGFYVVSCDDDDEPQLI